SHHSSPHIYTLSLHDALPILRKLSDDKTAFSGEYATVSNLVLKRDAATFTLRSGEIYFLTPVDGKTSGAVFFGDGEISMTPPVEDRKSTRLNSSHSQISYAVF